VRSARSREWVGKSRTRCANTIVTPFRGASTRSHVIRKRGADGGWGVNYEDQQRLHNVMSEDPAAILDMRREHDEILSAMLRMMIGRPIGQSTRSVFELAMMPSRVVKIAVIEKSLEANRREWAFSEAAKGTEYARWIAPCHHISRCSRLLVMDRCDPIPPETASDIEIPRIFQDTKIENWGMLGGRPVALDYEFTSDLPTNPHRNVLGYIRPWQHYGSDADGTLVDAQVNDVVPKH
jgi:hypothetical protein